MGDIDKLQPTYRIPPTRPAAGGGERGTRRKPETAERRPRKPSDRQPPRDDTPHVDEYA